MNSKNENLLAEFGGHFFMRKNTPGVTGGIDLRDGLNL